MSPNNPTPQHVMAPESGHGPCPESGLDRAVAAYLRDCQYRLRPATVAGYRTHLDHLRWWLARERRPLEPAAIMPNDLRSFLLYLREPRR